MLLFLLSCLRPAPILFPSLRLRGGGAGYPIAFIIYLHISMGAGSIARVHADFYG